MNPKTTFIAATKSLSPEFMQAIGAKNVTMVSPRSIRFDITPTSIGINRVKVTLQENGEWRMRTYKVEEVEDVPGIVPDSLQDAIKALSGMEG
jgi:hypothetical protein